MEEPQAVEWRRRTGPGATACLLALAIAGCGGGHRPANQQLLARQQITQTVRAYLRAQTAGDGPAACALLTAGAQQQLTTLVAQASKGLLKARPSCVDAVGLIRAIAGTKLLGALAQARVEHVQVSGGRATAQVVDGTQFPAQQVSLHKVGSAWKIGAVPGLGG
jgi:hypothetical protein